MKNILLYSSLSFTFIIINIFSPVLLSNAASNCNGSCRDLNDYSVSSSAFSGRCVDDPNAGTQICKESNRSSTSPPPPPKSQPAPAPPSMMAPLRPPSPPHPRIPTPPPKSQPAPAPRSMMAPRRSPPPPHPRIPTPPPKSQPSSTISSSTSSKDSYSASTSMMGLVQCRKL